MSDRLAFKRTMRENIREYQDYIKEQRELLEYFDEMPDLDWLSGEYKAGWDEQYHFDTPWDNEALDQLKALMLDEGWDLKLERDDLSTGWRKFEFTKRVKNKDPRASEPIMLCLRVFAHANRDGSTCKIVKIGEESVTAMKPIYEVTCPEGADVMEVSNE